MPAKDYFKGSRGVIIAFLALLAWGAALVACFDLFHSTSDIETACALDASRDGCAPPSPNLMTGSCNSVKLFVGFRATVISSLLKAFLLVNVQRRLTLLQPYRRGGLTSCGSVFAWHPHVLLRTDQPRSYRRTNALF